MANLLKIPSDGTLDFLALGAIVHRLDPGVIPFRKARECQLHVSGGEFNCAANLADCFGLRTGVVTAMVDYPIGDLIAERVRAMSVKPFYKRFPHNGVTGPNMAAVYSDRGHGVRAPVVFYNRANEAAAQLKPGDFDWNAIFGAGVRWFHTGGIFAALSPTTGELIHEAMQNIVRNVDVLVGNEEDLQRGLGIPGPAVKGSSQLDARAFLAMIDCVVERYPHIQAVATTLREVHSTSRHSWAAVAWVQGSGYTSPTCNLEIFDRVGGGDGFASGFFYGLLAGESPEQAVRLGWAHGALLTTFPGDTTMATVDQVRAFAASGSCRIQR